MVELEGRGDGARDGRLHGVQVASAQLLLPSLSPVAVPGIVVLLLSLQGDWGAILSMDCTRLGWSEALLAAGDVSITSSSSALVFSSVSRVQASSRQELGSQDSNVSAYAEAKEKSRLQ